MKGIPADKSTKKVFSRWKTIWESLKEDRLTQSIDGLAKKNENSFESITANFKISNEA